jgi:S1-C subfamily serine protease
MGASRRRFGRECARGRDEGGATTTVTRIGRFAGLAWLVVGVGAWFAPGAWAAPSPDDPHKAGFPFAATRQPAARSQPDRGVVPTDDCTFRPTVLVRRGSAQGSGTIIASVDGQTLVLTAAHVLEDAGAIEVELHRYNLGLERTPAPAGAWPRSIQATLIARDRAADLAILRVEGLAALPYVARLAPPRNEVVVDSIVTSIGIDLGTHLSSWSSRLVEALWFELNDNRDERLFLITARAPEHGRSGGGLFLPDGELVGVCIGHAELVRGRRQGVFASRESIRQLLIDSDLTSIISRSELERSRLGRADSRRFSANGGTSIGSGSSRVTPTRSFAAGS